MKSGWVLVLAVLLAINMSSCANSTPVTSSGAGFVWVATQGDQLIRAYTVNLSSGATSHVGGGTPSGAEPSAMAITPDRTLLFVANVDDSCGGSMVCNQVRAFTINTDATLTAVGTAQQITSPTSTPAGMAMGLAVDPTGKFLFVANEGNSGALGQAGTIPGTISIFAISSSGLNPVPNSPFQSALPGDLTGNGPTAVVASPSGNFLYVANQFTDTVGSFAYDGTVGSLTFIAGYNTGSNPSALAFSRCAGVTTATANCATADGNNLFVANSGSNDITVFAACIQASSTCTATDGSLTLAPSSPVAAGIGPEAIIVDPALNFVYVVDSGSNEISQYSYSSATGALAALTPAVVATGSHPVSGGITSDGSVVFAADNGGSTMSVFKVNNPVVTSTVQPTGKLGPASPPSVTLSGQPSAILVR